MVNVNSTFVYCRLIGLVQDRTAATWMVIYLEARRSLRPTIIFAVLESLLPFSSYAELEKEPILKLLRLAPVAICWEPLQSLASRFLQFLPYRRLLRLNHQISPPPKTWDLHLPFPHKDLP